MKNAIQLAGLALLIGILSSSCNSTPSPQKENRIAKVDSLIMVAEYLGEKMQKVDTAEVRREYPQVKELYLSIVEHYPDKETDKRFWIEEVNRIDQVDHAYEKFLKEAPLIYEQLSYSQEQLEALRNSIEDDKLTSAEADRYIEEEAQSLGTVHMRVSKRLPGVVTALAIWDRSKAHYDSLNTALLQQQ